MRELRRKRLMELLNGPRFNGDRSAFCRAADISKGRLTQLLDSKEAFGDVAARNLCESLSLSEGWFDSQDGHATGSIAPFTSNQAIAQQAQAATENVAKDDPLKAMVALYDMLPPEQRRGAVAAATKAMAAFLSHQSPTVVNHENPASHQDLPAYSLTDTKAA